MKNNVSKKAVIYYKMNRRGLRYNVLMPYIMMILISWIFCAGQFKIDYDLYNAYNFPDNRTLSVSLTDSEKNEVTDYRSSQSPREDGSEELELLSKLLKTAHLLYIAIAAVLMTVFVIREADSEKFSVELLRRLSFSDSQIFRFKTCTCARIVLCGSAVCLILALANFLMHWDVRKFLLDHLILTLPIIAIYPVFSTHHSSGKHTAA